MSIYRRYREELILAIIMIISAVMRFYNYSEWSLSNDELSALYGSWIGETKGYDAMITEYVRTDFHPAGIQVFLYWWTELFGNSVASVRFPFVIAGIVSVWFAYLIGARWFSKTTGLFTAATISFLGYTILYSQLARPYSFGLLFSLAAVYCWTRILFDPPGNKKLMLAMGWALALAGCMYSHYFSFLFVIMVGATGIIYLRKHNYIAYLFPAAIAVLLYLPHMSIALEQFGRGGVGTWLSKPEKGYFFEYLFYAFNNSLLLCIVIFLVALMSLLSNAKGLHWSKFRTIALVWFFVPFLVGYFYSVYVNPVLQYSILLFSFPFLLFFLFSFFDPDKKSFIAVTFAGLLVAGIYSTVAEQKFYSTQQFGVFKEIAEKNKEWDKMYGEHNITRTVNVITPYYINYYNDRKSGNAETGYFKTYQVGSTQQLGQLKRIIDSTNTEYFAHGWSNTWNPYDIYEIIKRKYPVIVEDKRYFNSGVTLFRKGTARKPSHTILNDIEQHYSYWPVDSSKLVQQPVHSGRYALLMDSLTEFGPALSSTVEQLYKGSDFIVVTAWSYSENINEAQIVISFEGEIKDWASVRIADLASNGKWDWSLITRKKPKNVLPTDPVKIYVWKPGGGKIVIDDMEVNTYPDSDYYYGF
jgi:hypothetical protein